MIPHFDQSLMKSNIVVALAVYEITYVTTKPILFGVCAEYEIPTSVRVGRWCECDGCMCIVHSFSCGTERWSKRTARYTINDNYAYHMHIVSSILISYVGYSYGYISVGTLVLAYTERCKRDVSIDWYDGWMDGRMCMGTKAFVLIFVL